MLSDNERRQLFAPAQLYRLRDRLLDKRQLSQNVFDFALFNAEAV